MSVFREEAIQSHAAGEHERSAILEISPEWTSWVYGLIVAAFLVALTYGLIGRVPEYAHGPGLVRVDGLLELTSRAGGTVREVLVEPGHRVSKGQRLVTFHAVDEAADLLRTERELESQLVRVLRDPNDKNARETLTSLRAQQERARIAVNERLLVAPHDGLISDIRIRTGQLIRPGEVVLSIAPSHPEYSVVAFLPGPQRPHVHQGMPMRFEIQHTEKSAMVVSLDSVASEIIGPSEARRFLGPRLEDAVPLDGPIVVVTGKVPASALNKADGHRLFSGVPGRAELRVRDEPILMRLVPSLKSIKNVFWPTRQMP